MRSHIKRRCTGCLVIIAVVSLCTASWAEAQGTPSPAPTESPAQPAAQPPATQPAAQPPATQPAAQQPVTEAAAQQPVTEAAARQPVTEPAAQPAATSDTSSQAASSKAPIDPVASTAETMAAEKKDRSRYAFILSYDMAVPVGPTRQDISAFSPKGMTLEFRYHLTPYVAVGGLVGWNKFEDKKQDTYVNDNVTFTGTQIRTLRAVHISGSVRYNFLPIDKRAVPFIGLDLGAYFLERKVDLGWWKNSDGDWHFGVAPGLGAIINISKVFLLLGTKFHYVAQTSQGDDEMYVTFNIGIGLAE